MHYKSSRRGTHNIMLNASVLLADAWEFLKRTAKGVCAATSEGVGGDCELGNKGSHRLPLQNWRPAVAWCLAKCAACPRCNYVSVSIQHADCSWYHRCDLSALTPWPAASTRVSTM